MHRLDPRTKIALTTAYIAMIFLVSNPVWYVVPLLYVALTARLAGLSFGQMLKTVRPLRVLLILTFVLNLFFSGGSTVWLQWGILTVTREGFLLAFHFSMTIHPFGRCGGVAGGEPAG